MSRTLASEIYYRSVIGRKCAILVVLFAAACNENLFGCNKNHIDETDFIFLRETVCMCILS